MKEKPNGLSRCLMKWVWLVVTAISISACGGSNYSDKFVGYIEADWVYVGAPQSGWVTATPVAEGDRVSAGDVLAEMDKDQQQARLAEAVGRARQTSAQAKDIATGARPAEIRALEAQLVQAEASFERAAKERDRVLPLVEQGIEAVNRGERVEADYRVAKAAVDAARENVNIARLSGREQARKAAVEASNSAQAAQAVAEWQLAERTIKSQVNGRVEEVFHHPGEFVNAGASLFAILPEDGLKVRFFVPQAKLPRIRRGQSIEVLADGLEQAVSAMITFVASEAEFTPPVIYSSESRDKLVFMVEARIAAGAGLYPGLPVDVVL